MGKGTHRVQGKDAEQTEDRMKGEQGKGGQNERRAGKGHWEGGAHCKGEHRERTHKVR